jgi:hypothetical protein
MRQKKAETKWKETRENEDNDTRTYQEKSKEA